MGSTLLPCPSEGRHEWLLGAFALDTPRSMIPPMVRPESHIELTGASPVAVSADAPRSRPRARDEIPSSEWGVKSLTGVVRLPGREQVRRPSVARTLQPREMSTRKGGLAEPLMARRRQQTPRVIGTGEDARGVWRRACGHSWVWNRRDPSRWPTSGEGGPYKPMAKGERAGRESEGSIVPPTPVDKVGRGKGPCFGRGHVREVSARAWSKDPTTPPFWVTTCENSNVAGTSWPSVNRSTHSVCGANPAGRRPVGGTERRCITLEACMPHVKPIGKPYAGNPHVRFERGPQETELKRHRA